MNKMTTNNQKQTPLNYKDFLSKTQYSELSIFSSKDERVNSIELAKQFKSLTFFSMLGLKDEFTAHEFFLTFCKAINSIIASTTTFDPNFSETVILNISEYPTFLSHIVDKRFLDDFVVEFEKLYA